LTALLPTSQKRPPVVRHYPASFENNPTSIEITEYNPAGGRTLTHYAHAHTAVQGIPIDYRTQRMHRPGSAWHRHAHCSKWVATAQ
jgi:hypothetical protein